MLYLFMGQSCTGKSTVAKKLQELMDVEVFSGKDYLRLAKGENEAWEKFYDKLSQAALDATGSQTSIVYLITEKGQLDKVSSIEGANRVKFTASLDTIKARFAQRMGGRLPAPVEKMLEGQYVQWEAVEGHITLDTTEDIDPMVAARSLM